MQCSSKAIARMMSGTSPLGEYTVPSVRRQMSCSIEIRRSTMNRMIRRCPGRVPFQEQRMIPDGVVKVLAVPPSKKGELGSTTAVSGRGLGAGCSRIACCAAFTTSGLIAGGCEMKHMPALAAKPMPRMIVSIFTSVSSLFPAPFLSSSNLAKGKDCMVYRAV